MADTVNGRGRILCKIELHIVIFVSVHMAFVTAFENDIICRWANGKRIIIDPDESIYGRNWIMHKNNIYQLRYMRRNGVTYEVHLVKLRDDGKNDLLAQVISLSSFATYIDMRNSVHLIPCNEGYIGCGGDYGHFHVFYVDVDTQTIELRDSIYINIRTSVWPAWDAVNQRLWLFYWKTYHHNDKISIGFTAYNADLQIHIDDLAEYPSYTSVCIYDNIMTLCYNSAKNTRKYDLTTGICIGCIRPSCCFSIGGQFLGEFVSVNRDDTGGEDIMRFYIIDQRTGDRYGICTTKFDRPQYNSGLYAIIPCSMQSLPADGHIWSQ